MADVGARGGHPLRVAFLNWRDANHPEAGGAEVFLTRVSAGLAARGHTVTVCTARYPGSLGHETVGDVTYVRHGGKLSVYPLTIAWLLRRRRQFDVVIDVQNGLPFWSPLLRKPVVNVTHHVHREQWRQVFGPGRAGVGWWLESRVAPRVYRGSRYFTVSDATRTELGLLGVDRDRINVGYSGLDPAPRLLGPTHTRKDPCPNLVAVGRLVPHKQIEIAIKTAVRLRDEFPGLTLTIVGGGHWRPTLQSLVTRLEAEDIVRFTGVVDDITKHELLQRAWLHLLPSVKEGWGLVVLEAAGHRTPTVALRSAGGTAESVLDGETGVLVDAPAGFTAATRALLADPDRIARMGLAAQAYARTFTWVATTAAVEAELFAAIGAPHDGSPSDLSDDVAQEISRPDRLSAPPRQSDGERRRRRDARAMRHLRPRPTSDRTSK